MIVHRRFVTAAPKPDESETWLRTAAGRPPAPGPEPEQRRPPVRVPHGPRQTPAAGPNADDYRRAMSHALRTGDRSQLDRLGVGDDGWRPA